MFIVYFEVGSLDSVADVLRLVHEFEQVLEGAGYKSTLVIMVDSTFL